MAAKVNVTCNLESALRHLRKQDVDIHIWADALCINQSDVSEKALQVRLMSQIYGNEKHVQC